MNAADETKALPHTVQASELPWSVAFLQRAFRLRQRLALLRLAMLYGALCASIAAAGLLWRSTLEGGVGLQRAPVRAGAPGAQPPFAGINIAIDAYAPEQLALRLRELRAAGFGWVRFHLAWRAMEPAPGQMTWDVADRVLEQVVSADLEPVIVLVGAPDWALSELDRSNGVHTGPPVDFTDFARFAESFARRYGDRVRYYQIWDEPNIAPNWGYRHINPVEYAQMLHTVAPAIRQVDPDAVILAAALAPTVDRGHLAIDEMFYLRRMIAAGAAPFFDVVAIQPFGFGYAATDPRQRPEILNFSRAAQIRRVLVDSGLGGKPIWAVRFGWNRMFNSPWGTVTPQAQARYAHDALERAWNEWPWLRAMGWVIDRPAEVPNMPAWGFALTDPVGTPAPVYTALRAWLQTPRSRPDIGEVTIPVVEWAVLLIVVALAGWRGLVAAQVVDWRAGLQWWRCAPQWVHLLAWGGLAIVYYLATFPPLIGLCWLAAVWLCLAQPQVGLWLALALIPFYFQHKELELVNWVLTVPPAHALVMALLPAMIVAIRRSRRSSHSNLYWWELVPLLLLPLTLLSAVNVWDGPAFVRGAFDLVIAPLGGWLAVRTLTTNAEERSRALWALCMGGILTAFVGLVNWLRGQGAEVDGIQRLVGPHFSPNHTALYLERSVFVGLAGWALVSKRWRTVTAVALLGMATALVLTGSRSALFLAAPAGLATCTGFLLCRRPAFVRWLRMRRRLLLSTMVVLAALLTLILFWQQERLGNVQTIELRLTLWIAAFALWRDHFWVGVGPGSFFWTYPAYLPVSAVEVDQLHPHNVWLELVTTWGVLGLAWFVLCALALRRAIRNRLHGEVVGFWLTAGACAGLAAGLAHAQSDAFMLLADIAMWNAVAWGLATAPDP